jgi:chromosomal replication initiator protein
MPLSEREIPNINHDSIAETWLNVQEELKKIVSKDAFQRWFRMSRLVGVDESFIVVSVPSDIHVVWIETNYLLELNEAFVSVFGHGKELRLIVSEEEISPTSNKISELRYGDELIPKEPLIESEDQLEKRIKLAGLNPQFHFDRFVVGSNSQFAHAACHAVASGKAVGFNPLFIHGGPGLGKTHLMQAIGQEWLKSRPNSRIAYFTCEKFTNEFIDAVKKGDVEKFRKRYRSAELMLIDDVQFIAGKERTQEEFFHTFNTLLDGQKQIVLTCDRPACDLKTLEPRLVSRFECGLTVELQIPLEETRIAILRRKMDEWKVKIDDSIINFLAEKIRSNVRRLEGALMRVATYASLAGESVTLEKVEHLLRDILREEALKKVSIDSIQKAVADHFDLRLADMTSRRRPASVAYPRQIAMYLSRNLTKNSLIDIGEAFGGRDHGTVIHACKKLTEQMKTQAGVKELIGMFESTLQR